MPNVISDTSCLIVLDKINALSVLKDLYSRVLITPEVQEEYGEELPAFIEIIPTKDKKYYSLLKSIVDPGEASSLALALEIDDSILIIDDLKGRKIAQKVGIRFTGTLGVILAAKDKGTIQNVAPLLDEIKNQNFRISEELEMKFLRLAKEDF